MTKLKSDGDILDRLSELPDSLILEILSLLDMRDVVRTTLLSKRWKDFWVTIPCLKFDEYGNDLVKILNFVNRTLTLWRGTHLREFSVSSSIAPEASLLMDMALWVQFATERKVEDLCINYYCGYPEYCPPQCLYECSSIRKLSMYRCNLRSRGNVKWDRLNTLKLVDCVFSEDVMDQIFSSSPQLEDLTVRCNIRIFKNFSIRSSSLKKLWIDYLNRYPSVLTIWAPNLQVLKSSGTPYVKCLLTDISSLTEVRLDISPGGWDVAVKEAMCQILPVIQHVVSIELSISCIKVIRALKENYSFSPLLNVKLLTIECCLIELSDIVGLLQSFPNLKMLVVNWRSLGKQFQFDAKNYTESEANILKSNLLQLRTVVITWDISFYNASFYNVSFYNASLFEFIGFLLKHATMLEKMVIGRKCMVNSEEMFEAAKKLMSLQRSFPSVELIICQR